MNTPTPGHADTVGDLSTNIKRAVQEFLGIPILLVASFAVLALLTYLVDLVEPGPTRGIRAFMVEHVFGDAESTSNLLGTIATSVITISSIILSLLLLAVQQAASGLSTQVFDQFMQRRANQAYFGYFLGVGLYSLLTLATVTQDFNPVFGGTIALALTALALVLIPLVLYSTLDQMRPPEIVSSIRTHGLEARERQLPLLARTRRQALVSGAGTSIRSTTTGFLGGIDFDAIDAVLDRFGPGAELELSASIGSFVAFGDELAILRGAESVTSESIQAIEKALRLDRERTLRDDPSYALAQLEAIGWTTISSSKQDPHGGLLSVFQLHDLVARWARVSTDPPVPEPESDSNEPRVSAVVYHDSLLEAAVRTLGSLAVIASEGMQHQVAAAIYAAFARTFEHLPPATRATASACIMRSLAGLGDHVPTLELEEALRDLITVIRRAGDASTASAVEAAINALVGSAGVISSRGNRAG